MGKGRAKSRRKERETRGVRTWCWGMAKGGGGSTPEQFSPAAEGKKKKNQSTLYFSSHLEYGFRRKQLKEAEHSKIADSERIQNSSSFVTNEKYLISMLHAIQESQNKNCSFQTC